MAKKCYISRKFADLFTAGNKAKTDMETILEEDGFRNIGLNDTRRKGRVGSFFAVLAGVVKGVVLLGRGDTLVLQYPLKKYYSFICRIAHLKGARVITLVHDLGSFRRHKLTPHREVRRLSNSDYIIALNPSMQRWLADNGCRVPSTALGIWDFLSSSAAPAHKPGATPKVVYAGALGRRKNSFLYEWGPAIEGFEVSLYGWGFNPDEAGNPANIKFHSYMLADELIRHADGDYGLVWDGDSIDCCSGAWGEYLRYNNPHKTSLYLRCGLPVIVWSGSALAPFVKEQGIGLEVNSLRELNELLPHITRERYAGMQANVERVAGRIASGCYFREALSRAMLALDGVNEKP